MPIDMTKFKNLPKVKPGSKKGGKKVDWDGVREAMTGTGGWPVTEVFDLTRKHALCEFEDGKHPIGKFRTSRWLANEVEKGRMEARDNDGTHVFLVLARVGGKANIKDVKVPVESKEE